MATKKQSSPAIAKPPRDELETEFAHRLRDPFEVAYMGVLRSNDPLLLEKGNGSATLYQDLLRDGKVFGGLQKRQLALIGKSWQVEPVNKKSPTATASVATVTTILKSFSFDKLCKELLLATILGWQVGEIVWRIDDAGLVVPARVPMRALRRFVYVQDHVDEPVQLRLLTQEDMLRGIPVPERKFIVHSVNPTDDNPYGTGLGLQLYWPVFFKRKGIVAWNKLCDRFGSPTPHGKYPRNAGPKEKGTLAAALQAMSNDGYLMTPEGMEIALLESKLTGTVTTQESLCSYMDDWIAGVLLGQESKVKGGGALAAASNERQDVRQELTQADSDLLSETLNQTLIKWICEYNGLDQCMVYRVIKDEPDTKAMAEGDKIVSDMGYELDEATVRAKYGEGWSKKQSATPVSAPAPTQAAADPKAASFAEATATDDPTRPISESLMTAGTPTFEGWVRQLEALVGQASSMADAQRLIVEAYGNLDSEQLVRVMAAGMALAELQGMADVASEANEASNG